MSETIKRNIHVRFSTEQRAALADQMADVQSQIDGVEEEKKKAMGGFNAKLKVLRSRMHEYAEAVRDGEGDVVIECMWKADPAKPFEHLWRLDTLEIIETRPLTGKAAEEARAADKQLDLTTPRPAPAPDGKAPAAGSTPGEASKAGGTITRLRVAPMPPCPAPVKGAPGGICGADGDRDFCEGFCQRHFAELEPSLRESILASILETRRQMRLQEASERRARQEAEAIATEEDEKRAKLHVQAQMAKGAELDAIGGPIGCARLAGEPDAAYLERVKVAIDQAHKEATARAVAAGESDVLRRKALAGEMAAITTLWDKGVRMLSRRNPDGSESSVPILRAEDGTLSIGEPLSAVPPTKLEKPRELTPDLVSQLARSARDGSIVAPPSPELSAALEAGGPFTIVDHKPESERAQELPTCEGCGFVPCAGNGGPCPGKMTAPILQSITNGGGPTISETVVLPGKIEEVHLEVHVEAGAADTNEGSVPVPYSMPEMMGMARTLEVFEGDSAPPDFDDGPAPGNEAPPPAPADEEIDGEQPIYNRRRVDGWPLCPSCEEDELFSPAIPPTEDTIVHCEACGWRPPKPFITTRPPLDTSVAPVAPFVPGKQVLHIGDVEIDTSGLLDHGRLLRSGPCSHTEEIRACADCTRAAVAEERKRLELRGAPPLPPGPVSEEVRQYAAEVHAAAPSVECPPLRRVVTATERSAHKASCECGKVVNIRPVAEEGQWVATLPKHKRLVQS